MSGRSSDFFGLFPLQSTFGKGVFYSALKGTSAQIFENPDHLHTYSYLPDIGRAVKIQVASRGLLRLIGNFNPIVRELVEVMHEFQAPFVVDDSRFCRTVHVSAIPSEQALEETIAWFKSHPEI